VFKSRRSCVGIILGTYNPLSGFSDGALGRNKVLGPKVVKELQAAAAGERAKVIRDAKVTHQEV
jgi:hypothetical protein